MRFLLDEGMPVQLLGPLRCNRGHDFDHVDDLGWKGKPDTFLFADAAKRGFDGIVTLDLDQLADQDEWRALKKSALHHVSLRQGRRVTGTAGVARIIGSVVVAMPYVLDELQPTGEQRIVEIAMLASGARHETFDPKRERNRYPYWRT